MAQSVLFTKFSGRTKQLSSDVLDLSLCKFLYLSGKTKTTSNCQLVARVWEYLHCLNVSLKLFISQLTSGKRAWRGQMSEAAYGCNYVHLVVLFCVTCVIVNDCVPAFKKKKKFLPPFPSVHLHAHLCEWAICRLCVFGCLVRSYTAHLVF